MNSLIGPLRLIAVLAIWIVAAAAAAQPDPGPGTTGLVTIDAVNAKLQELETDTALDDAARQTLQGLYNSTLGQLETASSNHATADAYSQAAENAPTQTRTILDEVERRRADSTPLILEVTNQTPLVEIEQILLTEKANLAAVEAKLGELDQQLELQNLRPSQARQQLTEARHKQEEIATAQQLTAPAGEDPMISEAKQWLLEAERQALSSEVRMLDQELLSHSARLDLLNAQQAQTALSVKRIGSRVNLLEDTVVQRRRVEAEEAQAEAEQTRQQASGKHPLVQELAEQNAALTTELRSLATELELVGAAEDEATDQAKRIQDDFRRTRQKLEVAGLSQVLGQVLLEQSRSLPDARFFRREARTRERLIAEAGLRQIRHVEEHKLLEDVDDYVDTLTAELALSIAETNRLHHELEQLVQTRRGLLDRAIETDNAYLQGLGELDFAQRQLLDVVELYDDFLDGRLLWVRTAPPPGLDTLRETMTNVGTFLSPSSWQRVLRTIFSGEAGSLIALCGLIIFAVLMHRKQRIREALRATGENVGKLRLDRFTDTFHALILTAVLALPWPLLLGALGLQLRLSEHTDDFTHAVADSLVVMFMPLFSLNGFRVLCEPQGLAAAHFRWPEPPLVILRRAIPRLIAVFIPSTFVAVVLLTLDTASLGGGLGRASFVIMMLALALFFYRIMDPRRGVLADHYEQHAAGAVYRLRHLWFVLGVVTPLALATLSLLGYLYTAGTLAGRLINSLWFIFGLFIIHQLVVRWLVLTRRRLAYQAALERREAQKAARKALGEEDQRTDSQSQTVQIEEPVIDYLALSQASRKLLSTALSVAAVIGLWAIWAEVLPAFQIFEEVTLWHHTGTVAGEEKLVPVTLADLGLALLVAVVAVVAARRLPSLIEIVLLQQLNITAGSRYAITTLASYLMWTVAALFIFNVIGIDWSQLQWLIAALGVGIGFGLQEIIANFISGIILLFERPIRVGDIVTIGNTDGVVTRIRIRATTIRNWDQKELLVPNKEFITGRLLNWTLSDAVTRIVVPVGVAYGSDVGKALSLMAEAATEHERVLDEPKFIVTFDEFGDNALTLVLRCYIGSMDYWRSTTSELHQAIYEKFEQAGIVIAFPQRDVHLDTTQPLDIRIHRGGPSEAPA